MEDVDPSLIEAGSGGDPSMETTSRGGAVHSTSYPEQGQPPNSYPIHNNVPGTPLVNTKATPRGGAIPSTAYPEPPPGPYLTPTPIPMSYYHHPHQQPHGQGRSHSQQPQGHGGPGASSHDIPGHSYTTRPGMPIHHQAQLLSYPHGIYNTAAPVHSQYIPSTQPVVSHSAPQQVPSDPSQTPAASIQHSIPAHRDVGYPPFPGTPMTQSFAATTGGTSPEPASTKSSKKGRRRTKRKRKDVSSCSESSDSDSHGFSDTDPEWCSSSDERSRRKKKKCKKVEDNPAYDRIIYDLSVQLRYEQKLSTLQWMCPRERNRTIEYAIRQAGYDGKLRSYARRKLREKWDGNHSSWKSKTLQAAKDKVARLLEEDPKLRICYSHKESQTHFFWRWEDGSMVGKDEFFQVFKFADDYVILEKCNPVAQKWMRNLYCQIMADARMYHLITTDPSKVRYSPLDKKETCFRDEWVKDNWTSMANGRVVSWKGRPERSDFAVRNHLWEHKPEKKKPKDDDGSHDRYRFIPPDERAEMEMALEMSANAAEGQRQQQPTSTSDDDEHVSTPDSSA